MNNSRSEMKNAMEEKVTLSVRCPEEIAEKLTQIAQEAHVTRAVLVAEALRLFSREVRQRGGFVVPPTRANILAKSPSTEPRAGARRRKRS